MKYKGCIVYSFFPSVDCADLQDRDKKSLKSNCKAKGLSWNLAGD